MTGKSIGFVALLVILFAAILPTQGLAQPPAAPRFNVPSDTPTPTETATATGTPAPDCALLTNLVSYWKLDEASGNAIDSVGTNTLTANHAPGSVAGKVNGARNFDGTNQFFSIPTNSSVEIGTSSFSFAAWATISDTTIYHNFVSKQTESDPTHIRDYSLYYDSSFQRFIFQASPDGSSLTRTMSSLTGVPLTNTWYFLAGGYDLAQSKIWISVNGGAKETADYSGLVHVGSPPFEIGGIDNPLFGNEAGQMDEVGFWKRSLSDADIAALYNGGSGLSYDFGVGACPTPSATSTATITQTPTTTSTPTVTGTPTVTRTPTSTGTKTATSTVTRTPTTTATRTQGPSPTPTATQAGYSCPLSTSLVSYWKLDEASGAAIDSVGANTLAAVNAPGSDAGIVNGARTFSGNHQYFSIPTNASLETGAIDFSFSVWVNMSDKTGNRDFIGKQVENDPTHIRDYSIYYDSTFDRIIFQAAGDDGYNLTRAMANSLGSPAINTWYFVTGGYDHANGYIWISIDGGPKETVPFSGAVHIGSAPFMLGSVANPDFGYHEGLMDEVGFWKRTLSSLDIARLYNGGAGTTYPFNPNARCSNAYLAIASKPDSGIHGHVTLNGAPAAGVPLELRFFNGTSYSTASSTTTNQSGVYNFADAPSLAPGQSYYVRFTNLSGTLGELWFWGTANITSFTAGGGVAAGDFDLADIALSSPANDSLVGLPVQFLWTPRPGLSTDSYQLALYDYADGDPFAQTAPLGYVGGVLITALPGTFHSNVPYAWEVRVNSPDGGQGISYGTRFIAFTNAVTGSSANASSSLYQVPSTQLPDRPPR